MGCWTTPHSCDLIGNRRSAVCAPVETLLDGGPPVWRERISRLGPREGGGRGNGAEATAAWRGNSWSVCLLQEQVLGRSCWQCADNCHRVFHQELLQGGGADLASGQLRADAGDGWCGVARA